MSGRVARMKRSGKVASVGTIRISSIGGGRMFVVMLRVSLRQKPKNRKIAMQNTISSNPPPQPAHHSLRVLVCANALPARCCHRVLSKKLIMAHGVMAMAVTAIWCDGNAALPHICCDPNSDWIELHFFSCSHEISWASVAQCFSEWTLANKIRGNGGDKQLHTHTDADADADTKQRNANGMNTSE